MQNTTDSLMTPSRFRGMWKMHTRAENAFRSVGNAEQAEQAKSCRERLVAAYPQYQIPDNLDMPTVAAVAESLGM